MEEVNVAAVEPAAERFTFFVVVGRTTVAVDYGRIPMPPLARAGKGSRTTGASPEGFWRAERTSSCHLR